MAAWFPAYAVASVAAYSMLWVIVNVTTLATHSGTAEQSQFTPMGKDLVIAALLGSLFSCLSAETVCKTADMYVIIPALIVMVGTVPEGPVAPWRQYLLAVLALLLLVPNDRCANPQNWWWLWHVGASPLTYVAPVNVLVLVTTGTPRRRRYVVAFVLTGLYYVACIYHRVVGGYY